MTDTYVSRIEHETDEDGGGAFLPHVGYGQGGRILTPAPLPRLGWG